ncbi:MAG: MBL fold metallo-hydrolase [Christensenellales bacterium]
MLITYHGHSEFLLQTASGFRILTDPFDPAVPWPFHRTRADLVTVSHAHNDHQHLEKVDGNPQVIRDLGLHKLPNGMRVTGFPSFHDEQEGLKRGKNTIMLIEADKLRIAHLGDLGAMPREEVLEALEDLDLIFVPVGGYYTIDAQMAAGLMSRLEPRIIIPMHFRQGERGYPVLSPAEDFMQALSPGEISRQPLLRFTHEDVGQVPQLVVLEASQAAEQGPFLPG